MCDLETSSMRHPRPKLSCCAKETRKERKIMLCYNFLVIAVEALSNGWVCCRLLVGIVGTLVSVVLCRYRLLSRADQSCRGVLPAVYLPVCELETSTVRRPRPDFGSSTTEKNYIISNVKQNSVFLMPVSLSLCRYHANQTKN